MLRSGFLVALCVIVTVAPALAIAGGWGRYDNGRFGYAIDVPPGFSEIVEAENGDGGISRGADGSAELRVWGHYLVVNDFKGEIADRVRADQAEGWTVSYDRRTTKAASWSGSRGDRIFYARAMKGCEEAAIYFRLEYGRADLDAFDSIVGRLVKSLHPTC
jgi:hypothetical protein